MSWIEHSTDTSSYMKSRELLKTLNEKISSYESLNPPKGSKEASNLIKLKLMKKITQSKIKKF